MEYERDIWLKLRLGLIIINKRAYTLSAVLLNPIDHFERLCIVDNQLPLVRSRDDVSALPVVGHTLHGILVRQQRHVAHNRLKNRRIQVNNWLIGRGAHIKKLMRSYEKYVCGRILYACFQNENQLSYFKVIAILVYSPASLTTRYLWARAFFS